MRPGQEDKVDDLQMTLSTLVWNSNTAASESHCSSRVTLESLTRDYDRFRYATA